LVVNTLDAARNLMGGVRLVTKAGELIEASGAMVGGTISPQSVMKFGQSSESKLDELGVQLRDANEALGIIISQLRDARNEIRNMDDDMRKANAAGMNTQAKIGQLNAQLSELRKTKSLLEQQLKDKITECENSQKELSESKENLGSIVEALENLRSERQAIRDRMSEIAPSGMQERIQNIRDRIFSLRGEVSDSEGERATILTEMAGLEKQKESLDVQLEAVTKKIDDYNSLIESHEVNVQTIHTELSGLRNMERDMESGIENLRNQKDELIQKRYSLDNRKNSIQEKLEITEGIRSSQEAQVEICRNVLDQIRIELEQLTVEVELPIPSEEEIRRTIKSCESLISRIGNVNLRAIEDYDEKKKRYDSLNDDVSKLQKQIKELDALAESLGSRKKGLFMKSYDAVNTNFREIYAQLSGGGEAYMNLEDEDDPFNGGLSINAKPKNGKLLRLEALSGGEKSLTALAFIFAIQEYQPSPFYVLDEVDMFLDAVNAEMVARMVKESSTRAQFIQVSLRKVTLALADHLIGVTRPPSGISKVIMQPDFDEVAKYEEEAKKKAHED
jgi:chromosome segregation protein